MGRSFVIAGTGAAYSEPQRWDHVEVQCTCPGRGGELVGVCVWCVRDVWDGSLSRSEQLVGYFYRVPLLRHCLLSWLVLCVDSASGQPSLFTSATSAWPTPWRCLIEMSATVTVYRGHHRTFFFLPGIISLFIVCV